VPSSTRSHLHSPALPYMFLSPALFATVAIIFFPIIYAVSLSFMDYVIWKPDEMGFVGLKNYIAVWDDEIFLISLKNTFVWIFGVIGLQLALGFMTALILNQQFPMRGVARAIILIPWVTPSVITALMWRWMYDGNTGVLNDLLVRVGLLERYVPWLAQGATALPAVMVALMWQGFPFFAIMILAGLQAIPTELYEVADVDGATTVQKFFRITFPMITPVLFTTILLRSIWVANSLDIIFIMTGGGPGYNSHTLPLYSYIKAYRGLDFGYAGTIAVYLTILLIAVVTLYVIRISQTEDQLG
jgi:multiple sugar transport system permease protein